MVLKHIQSDQPSFNIGNLPIKGDLILAPMDGISDQPFRKICRELGSSISYTEFVNSADVIRKSPSIKTKLTFDNAERPMMFQIYGEDVDELLTAAKLLLYRKPDSIDINMGCPSKSIANRGAGVGLMRNPLKVARIFRTLSTELSIPVTGKIRLGWDDESKNYALIARIIEENGGGMIAVHARTRAQGYKGVPDLDAVAEIADAVSIPVIGNGDVKTVDDIENMKRGTGCAGVMIGRAAIGNPWIFSRKDRESVATEIVHRLMLEHLEANIQFYGEEKGIVLFRKFAKRYLEPYSLARKDLLPLLRTSKSADVISIINELFNSIITTNQEKQ